MSKAKLKKELSQMNDEQLRGIILDAYDARREFKEYFDFFLNPDIEKLREKYDKLFVKEAFRSKWGRSKARVSVFKKLQSQILGYKLGVEEEMKIRLRIIDLLGQMVHCHYTTETQTRFVTACAKDYIEFGNNNGVADVVLKDLNKLAYESNYPKEYRNRIADALLNK